MLAHERSRFKEVRSGRVLTFNWRFACAIMIQMSGLRDIRAVIFDMDGLLLDSERVALSTFVDACRESGFEPDVEVYYRCIGGNDVRTRQILTEGYGRSFPFDAVDRRWHIAYEDLAANRPFPLKTGALELLRFLDTKHVRKAVVTSTRRESAIRKVSNARLLQFFEFVIGGDDIQRSKPDPEIYLTACRRLGEIPENCLALEDSDNGVLSASAAGLQVIQVPDMLEPSSEVKAIGHTILPSLLDVEKLLRDGAKYES
jgi:HAD superfamily hydrolase (TIGR01509 family)